MTATRQRRTAALAAGVLLVLTGSACSAGSSDDSSSDTAGSTAASAPAAADVGSGGGGSGGGSGSGGSVAEDAADTSSVAQQQVISTGSVQLSAADVAKAAAGVRAVAARYAGTISQDSTQTDDDGDPRSASLVLRVPTAGFDAALADLGEVATLVGSDSSTEDVTTQVLDTDVRVESQRRSIQRIQVLFDQATSIDDIVRIENELSSRQADLASLEQQQRYLSDQTRLSTITVSVERPATGSAPDPDRSGFIAGLDAGWSGLSAFAVALATVAGALLPWLVVLLVLGPPLWLVTRRLRRRRGAVPGAPQPAP